MVAVVIVLAAAIGTSFLGFGDPLDRGARASIETAVAPGIDDGLGDRTDRYGKRRAAHRRRGAHGGYYDRIHRCRVHVALGVDRPRAGDHDLSGDDLSNR